MMVGRVPRICCSIVLVSAMLALNLRAPALAQAGDIGAPTPPDSTMQPDAHLDSGSSVRSGAITGAIFGGIVGTGAALLLSALGEGLCDAQDCEDLDGGDYVARGLLGAAIGAGAGALLGVFLGSTAPDSDGPTDTPVEAVGVGSGSGYGRTRGSVTVIEIGHTLVAVHDGLR